MDLIRRKWKRTTCYSFYWPIMIGRLLPLIQWWRKKVLTSIAPLIPEKSRCEMTFSQSLSLCAAFFVLPNYLSLNLPLVSLCLRISLSLHLYPLLCLCSACTTFLVSLSVLHAHLLSAFNVSFFSRCSSTPTFYLCWHFQSSDFRHKLHRLYYSCCCANLLSAGNKAWPEPAH